MYKKRVIFILGILMISWSIATLAEEWENLSKEEQIGQLKMQIEQIEYALKNSPDDERVSEWQENLQKTQKNLERLMVAPGTSEKFSQELPEIEKAIRHINVNLAELRQELRNMKANDGEPEKLVEIQREIGQEERKLAELNAILEERSGLAVTEEVLPEEIKPGKIRSMRQERDIPQIKLMFFPLEHADVQNLSKIIKEFLAPSAIVVPDSDTDILIVMAIQNDLKIAAAIVKNLDIPRKRGGYGPQIRQTAPQRIYFGEVLESGAEFLTIQTKDSQEEITLYVPLYPRGDGTSVLNKDISIDILGLVIGSNVKVQWKPSKETDGEKKWIVKVTEIE